MAEGLSKVTIYSDGACRGNGKRGKDAGRGGYGTVWVYVKRSGEVRTMERSQGYRKTTNNRMELMGAIVGLEALKRPCEVELHTDSEYVVNAFNKHWIEGWQRRGWRKADKQPVKNQDLWKRLLAAMETHKVTWVWVKGHANDELNERCDKLATDAADGGDLIEDAGFTG